MFEFVLFVAACAVIAFLVANIQKSVSQPKTKLQPIKIEREEKRQPIRRQRPY
ncbi:hypothetical protein [Marinomonas aquiplantarum]|uniref:Uncharacterized protein n=1 Tax=Marinomonas aquiplantarum TaxID=491951 RepID=A0A366D2U3_9GAMM|nr:hypothetical protein [Marinomonas aquiplantarum]RBO83754.1 hypothetical protein DFP76_10326 [Marinomonas aquiplantarum]